MLSQSANMPAFIHVEGKSHEFKIFFNVGLYVVGIGYDWLSDYGADIVEENTVIVLVMEHAIT